MTHVVVNDASSLIDLRKGQLLYALRYLPFHFAVPFSIRTQELLSFTEEDWNCLEDGGLEVLDLDPEIVGKAEVLRLEHKRLSINDCIAFVSTQLYEGGVLLTGDSLLRKTAQQLGLRVHGVLWVVDMLQKHSACKPEVCIKALRNWQSDPMVFLPRKQIEQRLSHLLHP